MRHSLGHDFLWAESPLLLKDSTDDRHVLLHCLHARPGLNSSHALCSSITVSATGWTHKCTILTDLPWLWVEAIGSLLRLPGLSLVPQHRSPSIAIARDGGTVYAGRGYQVLAQVLLEEDFFPSSACPQGVPISSWGY